MADSARPTRLNCRGGFQTRPYVSLLVPKLLLGNPFSGKALLCDLISNRIH
jgi:hypothetical protein